MAKIKDIRAFMKDIDLEFAKYISETGDTKVSALLTKIIGKAIKRFPNLTYHVKGDKQ